MDYHVFILSRIRERCACGMSTPEAVTDGIAASGGMVTSAAVIMVAVFSIFATLSFTDVKTLGVGLAFAVLVDATVVRGILLPAAMTLLGERSWFLPGWLGWLPGRHSAGHDDGARASGQALNRQPLLGQYADVASPLPRDACGLSGRLLHRAWPSHHGSGVTGH